MSAPSPTARSVVVWVVAQPGDPSLDVLDPAPAGVRLVVGTEPEEFDGAPRPDVVFDCWSGPRRVAGVLARTPDLEWFHSRSAGLEGVLVPELVASPATVTNGRGAFSQSLAEFALAALLFFTKDLRRLVRSQEAGQWDEFDPEMLHGRTLGIVGYGDIGRTTAGLLRPLGVRVLALRRRPELSREDPLLDEVLPVERLDELVSRVDDVLVAAPLTPETRGLVDAGALAALKETAILVNVGRGAVVDEAALVATLEQGRIRGAALDVFETEPLPAGHPFWRLPNVLLSPHCADHVPGWVEDGTRVFLKNLHRFQRGEPLLNVVDKARGY
jgi:phosphoglycerate dehydrogenase-like enzyme